MHPTWTAPTSAHTASALPDFGALSAPEQDAALAASLSAWLDARQATLRPPLADELAAGVPIYDLARAPIAQRSAADLQALMAEWHQVLAHGAGVLVLRGAWADRALLDETSAAFFDLIEVERAERAAGGGGTAGDHFAKAGANDRVWNALQKFCLAQPALFARYYANPALAAVSRTWLGPGYQITSQLNCVNPGGQAQQPHRDYPLGFCSAAQALAFPQALHGLSPHLTLQGAVAHADMPLESGPTLLLPHSQAWPAGYLVAGRPACDAVFAQRHVQLPLAAGDGVFFNPALIHAAGANRSADIRRLANLLQVCSAFGRAMESVDRTAMSAALYPALRKALADRQLNRQQAADAVAACAEGYAFPTNLDLDLPIGGLAPQTQQALMLQALDECWPTERTLAALQARAQARRA